MRDHGSWSLSEVIRQNVAWPGWMPKTAFPRLGTNASLYLRHEQHKGFVSLDEVQLAFWVAGTSKGVVRKYEVDVFLCQLFF